MTDQKAKDVPSQGADWADIRLGAAHKLIEDVLHFTHPESDVHALLRQAAEAVENADVALEGSR